MWSCRVLKILSINSQYLFSDFLVADVSIVQMMPSTQSTNRPRKAVQQNTQSNIQPGHKPADCKP